jgi:HK97 family phage prohead protease
MDKKTFAVAEVKAAESENPNGEFEVILSAETVDRDGEIIDAKAFEPLPDSIPFHAFHDFHDPIGRGVPFYDGDVLKARGVFASTTRAQEIRTLVSEGVIGHTSVGFMAAVRKDADDDAPHVTKGELLEGSFVSVPSNREAAVLMAKEFDAAAAKAGARNSTKDSERLQTIHDLAVTNGAQCAGTAEATPAPETPSTSTTDEDGKSPASNVVEMARIRADIARLSLTD